MHVADLIVAQMMNEVKAGVTDRQVWDQQAEPQLTVLLAGAIAQTKAH
jgi:hypothetical protein